MQQNSGTVQEIVLLYIQKEFPTLDQLQMASLYNSFRWKKPLKYKMM